MHFLLAAVAFFLTVAASAPAPALSKMPMVKLRIRGPDATHYVPSTQNASSDGHIIELPIGTSLSSLELLLQSIEIVHVDGGVEVFCKANIDHSSEGRIVSSKETGMVWLEQANGGAVKVTGLYCDFGSGGVQAIKNRHVA